MKKLSKKALIITIVSALCVICLATLAVVLIVKPDDDNPTPDGVVVESIEIAKQPTKTEYYVGEKFSRSGMRVVAKFSDGTTKTVIGYSISNTNPLTLEDKEIVVSYKEKTAVVYITVTEKSIEMQIQVESAATYTYKVEAEDLPFASDDIVTFDRTTYFEYHSQTSNNPNTSGGISLSSDAFKWSNEIIYLRINSKVETTANIVLAMAYNPSLNFDECVKTVWNDDVITTNFTVARTPGSASEWFDWNEYVIEGLQLKVGVNVLSLTLIGSDSTEPAFDYVKLEVSPVDLEKVTGIEITSNPDKTSYAEGQYFDTAGLVISACMEDGSKIAINDYVFDKTRFSYGDVEVKVTYKDQWTASIPVTVKKPVVKSLAVIANPDLTDYYIGQTFNPAGLVVTATLTDDSEIDVTKYLEYDHVVIVEGDTKIVATYVTEDKKFTIDIPVNQMEASHATITSSESANYRVEAEDAVFITGGGNKDKYTVKEDANASGGKRLDSCDWLNGASFMVMFTSEVETVARFTICFDTPGINIDNVTKMTFNGEAITFGNYKQSGSWGVFSANQALQLITIKKGVNVFVLTFTSDSMINYDYFELNVNSVTELTVSGDYKTEYNEGETFDTDGMEVNVTLLDGTEKTLVSTDYTITPGGALTDEDTKVKLSYAGVSKDIPVTVIRTSKTTRIEIDDTNVKKEYCAGEPFDTEGLVVTAYFENGKSRVVNGYTIVEEYVGLGDTFVTVEFEDCTARIEGISGTALITIDGTEPSYRVEAEDAVFVSGNPDKSSYKVVDDINASGGKRLDSCDWLEGSTFTISINSTVAKKIKIIVSTDGPGVSLQSVANLSWNREGKAFSVTPSGGWESFAPYEIVEVDLEEGVNILVWTIAGNINYDYFEIQIVE